MTKEMHPNTVENVAQQQSASKTALAEATVWLKETFPATFAEGRAIVPLKINIAKDLQAYLIAHPAVTHSNTKVRKALACYTRQRHYARILRTGSPRIDLDGNPAGEVTEEESDSAYGKLKRKIKSNNRRSPGRSFNTRRTPAENNTKIKIKRRFSKPLNPNFTKISLNKKLEPVT